MADDSMALVETLRKAIGDGDVDVLREGVRVLAQAIMEAEVSELTGLPKGERDPERRLTHRNGYRDRRWDTRVGTIDLASPASATAATSPPCSSPAGAPSGPCSRSSRRHTCWASHAACRRPRPGPRDRRISRSEVSRICAGARRRGRRLPRPSARGRGVSLPLARRHVPEGPRGRAGRVDGGPRRDRGRPQRRAAGARPRACRRATTRDRLAPLHPLARRARPPRRPPRH